MKIHPIAILILATAISQTRTEAQSVGLNFSVPDKPATELAVEETAGSSETAQSHWNNLSGPKGGRSPLVDADGKEISSLSAEWTVPAGDTLWRSKTAKSWGFTGANQKLQTGYIQLGGSLAVTGVPYAKYDVYVYLGAGDSGGRGSVSISSADGKVDPNQTYYYQLGWLDGKFTASAATSADAAASGNLVIFSGNTARGFVLDWKGDLGGGWTGVTGVQVVDAP